MVVSFVDTHGANHHLSSGAVEGLTMSIRRIVLSVILLATGVFAQVSPPRHESRLHHLLTSHRESNNLEQRFTALKCALVVVKTPLRSGTGFFISPNGDVLTAAHVMGDKVFGVNPDDTIRVTLVNMAPIVTIESATESTTLPAISALEIDADQWLVDLAVIKTGKPTKCWLRAAEDRSIRTGQRILAMGFPELAYGSLTLYTGTVSGRLTINRPMGKTDAGIALKFPNDFVRVQVPASPGLSGGPVIDDDNRVIAVVTQGGLWSQELELLSQFENLRENTVPPNQMQTQITVDWISATGQLARLFHDWASPGYGDAVPMKYLKRKVAQSNPPSDKPSH